MALTMADIRATLGLPKDATTAQLLAEVDKRVAARRGRLIDAAVADGRLVEASRAGWMTTLARDGVEAERVLSSLVSPKIAMQEARVAELPWSPGLAPTRKGVTT